MYKVIGGIITLFLFTFSASGQVKSQAIITATVVHPVGVELEEGVVKGDPPSIKVIGIDQCYSITVWDGGKNVGLNDMQPVVAVKPKEITVNFE